MFTQLELGSDRRRALKASLLMHGVLLAWLLVPPAAIFVKPSSVVAGKGGTSVTYLYWPQATQGSLGQKQSRLTWTKPAPAKKSRQQVPVSRVQEEEQETAGKKDNGPAAGSPYGSLAYGSTEGLEIRPAIRVTGSEPYVNIADLAGIKEGNIVIEVTIDERGNIVQKIVLQSLGPAVDNKVLAALEDWHFLPATEDGVAIPSKQDVHYHFPVRR